MTVSYNDVKFSTVVELLGYRALHQPDQVAFIFLEDGETETGSLTYQQLDQQARVIAAQLQSLGMKGERALLLYPPGLEFIAAFYGCLYAGVVAVPAYPPRPNQSLYRLQAIVADAQAALVLTTTTVLSHVERQFAQFEHLQALCWLATEQINSDLAAQWHLPVVNSESLALLQYTSGSTGTPKGVMLSHGNLLHNSAAIQQCFQHTSDSRGVSWLPPYHDMGLIGGVLQPLYVGASMVLMSPVAFLQKPYRWLMTISRYQATTSGGPNFAYDLCVRRVTPEQRANLDLKSWEVAFNGAEPVQAETLERFTEAFAACGFGASAFYPCYGMAETTLIVSGGLKTDPPVFYKVEGTALEQNLVVADGVEQKGIRTLVGCGQIPSTHKVVIVNPESLRQCPSDRVGEIWVSCPSVAQGYWNQPEQTQRIFHAYLADTGKGPFLRTGDLGFLKDGELFVTGRLKDLIIIRGRNHYPQDIELTVEQSHPSLRPGCGAAFSIDVDGVEELVVAQEVERSYLRKLDVDEVSTAIAQAVWEHHELQVYAIVLLKTGSIPKTSSGKIQRYACRAGFLAGSLQLVGKWFQSSKGSEPDTGSNKHNYDEQLLLPQQPQTVAAIQLWLVTRISERLKVEPHTIDVREPFSRYGLDSLQAVSLSGDLEDWLGRKLSPTLVYDYSTIETLARYLAEEPDISMSITQVQIDDRTETESIAIVGIGCRFPGAENLEAFWQFL